MTTVELSKEAGQLQEQLEQVRKEITETLLEIDLIELQLNPQIEADYAVKIGCLENELLQAQIAARRAKRKLALAQARVNQGEIIAEEEIEDILDEEFEEWEAQLALQVENYLKQLERRANSRPLNPVEVKELRSLHRELVKRLHPDLHPMQTEEEMRLFAVVQAAFKSGDLETLRSVEMTTKYLAKDETHEHDSLEELNAEYELLSAQLRVIQERLDALKNSNPYLLRDKLASATWVHERSEALKAEIAEQGQAKKAYMDKLQELMEAQDAK